MKLVTKKSKPKPRWEVVLKENQLMEVADSHFDVFDLLVKYRKSMFAITVVFSVASVLFALSIPNQYRATALLVPAEANSGGIRT